MDDIKTCFFILQDRKVLYIFAA